MDNQPRPASKIHRRMGSVSRLWGEAPLSGEAPHAKTRVPQQRALIHLLGIELLLGRRHSGPAPARRRSRCAAAASPTDRPQPGGHRGLRTSPAQQKVDEPAGKLLLPEGDSIDVLRVQLVVANLISASVSRRPINFDCIGMVS